MSKKPRHRGIRVLKAISSKIRLEILNSLFDEGALSYTELMSFLKMNPSRDAGRFAYHLKFLLKEALIEANVDSKKYQLTDIGKMVINVAEEIERKTRKKKPKLVRTSRFEVEEFDANKIADSLTIETHMPVELAQRIAKRTEKRLTKSKTKYLTAPLVREIVNAILIERGLEEYRHRLTRLGLPVHDVTKLIDSQTNQKHSSETIYATAGKAVLREYTLLNVLPRDISDAHLDGSLHLHDLDGWILKPTEVFHDIRWLIHRKHFADSRTSPSTNLAPKRWDRILLHLFNTLLQISREVSTQTLDYFNVFLAPYFTGKHLPEAKETLRWFILNLEQCPNVMLGIELIIPPFLANDKITSFSGEKLTYQEVGKESQQIATLLFEILEETNKSRLPITSKLAIKVRREVFKDEYAKTLLLAAHDLTLLKNPPYFVNVVGKEYEKAVVSSTGRIQILPLTSKWVDETLRTVNVGQVTINLPRITNESNKDTSKFLKLFHERLEMADRALDMKYRNLCQREQGLLSFLTNLESQDQYVQLENGLRLLNFAGLRECAEGFHNEKNFYQNDDARNFAKEILNYVEEYVGIKDEKSQSQLLPAILPDSRNQLNRITRLDLERFGIAKIKFSGSKETPYYTTTTRLNIDETGLPEGPLMFERKLHDFCRGGTLLNLDLNPGQYTSQELLTFSTELIQKYHIAFFTYNLRTKRQ